MKVLCYGDSNTYGYDPRSYLTARYPEDIRWTGLLPQDWEVVNWGMNGREVPGPDTWESLDLALSKEAPLDVMTIMLGTNDLLQHHRLSPQEIADRMEIFLLHLQTHPALHDATLLLIAPPPMILGTWAYNEFSLHRSRQLTACYKALAQRLGLPFADAGDWEVSLAYDGVHFLPAGHQAFAVGLVQYLTSLQDR